MDDTRRQERSRVLGETLPDDLGAGAAALQEHAGTGDPGSDPEAARLHTLLEVAYLAATADGELADAEIHHLAANLQAWLQAELEPSFLVGLFEHLARQLAVDGFDARLAAAAASLDAESRRTAYRLACVTALCDLDVHDDELSFLGTIAHAFTIPQEEAQAIFDELDEAVTAL
jgi:hypothetical protein